ncbi:MAG: LssY C-terminal domain-containing protein [Vicinamibacteria bacterium]
MNRTTAVVTAMALACAAPGRAVELPAGTPLSIRLTTQVSSRSSRPGQTVGGVLIAPVEVSGRLVLPAGDAVRGTVREVEKLHGRASLRLDFSELVDEDGGVVPVSTRVTSIEDSRESVAEDGRIVGFRPMHRLPSPLVVLAMLVADLDLPIIGAFAAGRLVLRAMAHSAIDYRPGVELTLALEAPLEVTEPAPTVPPPAADPVFFAQAQSLPFRTQSANHHRDSDVTNLMFVGSQAQVETAFVGAGWTLARSMGLRARLRGLEALLEHRDYKPAAVSRQDLEGCPADLVFEKQNNTLAKRHHIRIWRYSEAPAGETVWVGAATHDVGIAFSRRDHAFTHRIDPRIDVEREKIVNDLQLTGQVAAVSLVDRAETPPLATGTGPGAMETDGRMAVVVLRSADVPQRE